MPKLALISRRMFSRRMALVGDRDLSAGEARAVLALQQAANCALSSAKKSVVLAPFHMAPRSHRRLQPPKADILVAVTDFRL